MGDNCNVTTRRSDDSPSSSSPTLGAARIKDLDECRVREFPKEERDSLLRSRPDSGEPGEILHKIPDNKHVLGNDLHEDECFAADASKSAILLSQRGRQTAFPFETKLRPDAPPFTPESLARSGPVGRQVDGINDSVCGDPNSELQAEIDDSCFVNVDLRSNIEETIVPMISPKPKQRIVANPQTSGPNAGIRDSRDPLKDPGLKPFSLTSTPRLKRSPPKINISVDSLHADIEMNEAVPVITESGANDPDIRESGPDTGEPTVVRGHWRILRTAFVIGNRIQIAVFIASIVLCVIIVVYVFV